MDTAATRRAVPFLLALAALSLVACSRDLDLPESSPPRIDAVAVVGLEPQAVASSLPVLGGELVAIRGAGFPSDVAAVEVRIGSADAEVLDARFDRIVARMPTLGTWGRVDLSVRTAVGFRTQAGAFRYDGPGQPSGFGSSDLDTSVALGFVAPVQPPGTWGFSDLAVATGASDSALLVVPAVGLAVAAVPLGIVPSSAAGWIDVGWNPQVNANSARLNVLAVSRGGGAALGTAFLEGSSVQSLQAVRPLTVHPTLNPSPCALPQVVATYGTTFPFDGKLVATWAEGPLADQHKIATIDRNAAVDRGELAPVGDAAGIHSTAAISGWGPWGASSVVLAANGLTRDVWVYDAATPLTQPKVLKVQKNGAGLAVPISSLLTPECGATIEHIYTLATATTRTTDVPPAVSEVIALAYRAGGIDRVALVDLGAGTVRSGIAGMIPTSLSLAPDPAYAAGRVGWQVLAAGGTNLFRFRPVEGAPACGDLVADTVLPLSANEGYLGGFGAMATVADGTRLLSLTPDGDLVTVLPPSLTSAGPIVRFASYGGVSIQQATLGGVSFPMAIAEHASTDTSVSDLDVGSALLLVSLASDGGSVALGGSGYGRGAVWLDVPGGGALAYTGDLRAAGTGDVFRQGGAASVTHFSGGVCAGESVRVGASRPVASGPDLVVQGPARSGALGPDGVARYGPGVPPVYTVKDRTLHLYTPDADTLDCLAGTSGSDPNWDPTQLGTCAPDDKIALGFDPLDVTLSAGDRSAAMRYLGECSVATICRPGDKVCERAACPIASALVIARPDPEVAATLAVPLPASPASVAADRGGGFLVTMRCEAPANGPSGECFRSDMLCDEYGTVPGEENGALVLVSEDGSSRQCLAVQAALNGPVSVTPNGAEAWVSGVTAAGQYLVRLGLTRRASDGAIDATRPAALLSSEHLYTPPPGNTAPPGGVAFTPDGATAIVTVPGQYRVMLRE
jgi:hypothetical protein